MPPSQLAEDNVIVQVGFNHVKSTESIASMVLSGAAEDQPSTSSPRASQNPKDTGINISTEYHHPQLQNSVPVNEGTEGTNMLESNSQSQESPEEPPPPHAAVSKSLTIRLFLSHFLSTWNSRLFEMGAVLFLATIFPGTLRPMSIYALARSGAAILLSPAVGSWIDTGDRLNVVRFSIVGQRLAVALSCGLFWVLYEKRKEHSKLTTGLFALTVILACVEKLCAIMNLVSVERDWVVVITQDNDVARRLLNARMRRIDLFCKLMGPLVIALVNGASTMIAIWVALGMNCSSLPVEYFAIATVFKRVPTLRRTTTADAEEGFELGTGAMDNTGPRPVQRSQSLLDSLRLLASRLIPLKSLPFYFHHPAFLPSISLSLLYLTVLSFSGQMITFLLDVGFTSTHVGIARAISTVFELSATWIAPRVQKRIGAVRGGIWFLSWQMLWLAGGISWFFGAGSEHEALGRMKVTIFAASGLVGGVILSRIGLWGFDLCAQSIVQEEVDEDNRGAFSTVEASFQNVFELLSYASTIVFARPDQFQWPVVISVGAVYTAGGLYTAFVRRRRGHLVHAPSCIKPKLDEDT